LYVSLSYWRLMASILISICIISFQFVGCGLSYNAISSGNILNNIVIQIRSLDTISETLVFLILSWSVRNYFRVNHS